jgi:hypothetical protein
MQDSGYADGVGLGSVDDDMRPDYVGQEQLWKIFAGLAKLRVMADRLQSVVNLASVDLQLLLAPRLPGVAQDVDEVLPGLG